MIINELTDKQKAIIYTHIIYRDTELEEFHVKNKRMTDELYKIVLEIVTKNLQRVKSNQNILNRVANETELKKQLETMYMTRSIELIGFIRQMYAYKEVLPGADWDEAEPVDLEISENLPAFILNGRFLECCKKEMFLDDITMRYVNKDVHDRIYTLILNKLL